MAEMMLASRLGREASIISAIPVVQEACYEPPALCANVLM